MSKKQSKNGSRPSSNYSLYSMKSVKEKPTFENNNHLAPPGMTAISISPPEDDTLSQKLGGLTLNLNSTEPFDTKSTKSRNQSDELRKHNSSGSFLSMKDSSKFGSIRANENDIKNFLRNNAHIQQSSLSSARKVETSSPPSNTPISIPIEPLATIPESTITVTENNNDKQ